MKAFREHFLFELRSAVRNPSQLLLSYLFPVGFFLFMAAMQSGADAGARALLVPTYAILALLTGGVLGLPAPMVEARNGGVVRGFQILGVPKALALGMPCLTTALHGLIAAALVSGLAILAFDAPAPQQPIAFAGVLVLAAFVYAGLGALIGVLSPSNRATVLWSQAIFLPSMLLGGLMVPVESLPPDMRPFSVLLPSTHLMQLMQGLGDGAASARPAVAVALLLSCGALAFGLAAWRYSAEARSLRSWQAAGVVVALLPLALAL